MPVSFIHPNLLTHLASRGSATPFPNLITRKVIVRTYDLDTNEPIDTLTIDPLMQNIAAYIEPIDKQKGEIRRVDQTIVENAYNISLAGSYGIQVDDTVVDEFDNEYNVLHVDQDAFRTQTTLLCEMINIEPQ